MKRCILKFEPETNRPFAEWGLLDKENPKKCLVLFKYKAMLIYFCDFKRFKGFVSGS